MNLHLLKFILSNIFIICIFLFSAFFVRNRRLRRKKKQEQTLLEFFKNGHSGNMKSLVVGLTFGIVFGFIDNFGLWVGISELERYMPGGVKVKAALGNTYSDGIGALLGTFVSIIAKDLYDSEDLENDPLWVNPIGIIIGCIIGIMVGKTFNL
jgi:hypothetical protein